MSMAMCNAVGPCNSHSRRIYGSHGVTHQAAPCAMQAMQSWHWHQHAPSSTGHAPCATSHSMYPAEVIHIHKDSYNRRHTDGSHSHGHSSSRGRARQPSHRCHCLSPTTAAYHQSGIYTTPIGTEDPFLSSPAPLSTAAGQCASSIVPSSLGARPHPALYPSHPTPNPCSSSRPLLSTASNTSLLSIPLVTLARLSSATTSADTSVTPSSLLSYLTRDPREPPLCHVPSNFSEEYELQTLLGAGEYGRVWRAVHVRSGELRAVKVVPKLRPDRTPDENLRRIECEVNIWRQCQASQYVCRLHDVFQDADNVYLVQELCTGGDLRALVQDGPVTELDAAHIMRAVLDVVAMCHSNNITFGDIKPANFLLKEPLRRKRRHHEPAPTDGAAATHANASASATAAATAAVTDVAATATATATTHTASKVQQAAADAEEGSDVPALRATDFGFSHRCDIAHVSKQRMGSPVYMAPELWCQECGSAADVWAAGVMMFQLLSARYPFWEEPASAVDHLSLYQVMLAVSSNPIRLTGPEWEGVSRPAQNLVMAMLDRNSSTRITAEQALAHPWFQRMLGHSPQPTTVQLDAACRNGQGASR